MIPHKRDDILSQRFSANVNVTFVFCQTEFSVYFMSMFQSISCIHSEMMIIVLGI